MYELPQRFKMTFLVSTRCLIENIGWMSRTLILKYNIDHPNQSKVLGGNKYFFSRRFIYKVNTFFYPILAAALHSRVCILKMPFFTQILLCINFLLFVPLFFNKCFGAFVDEKFTFFKTISKKEEENVYRQFSVPYKSKHI